MEKLAWYVLAFVPVGILIAIAFDRDTGGLIIFGAGAISAVCGRWSEIKQVNDSKKRG